MTPSEIIRSEWCCEEHFQGREAPKTASQVAAARFPDTVSNLPSMTGEASDAVSACAQVKMGDTSEVLKLAKNECPEISTMPTELEQD